MQMHECANIWICKTTHIPNWKYANIQISAIIVQVLSWIVQRLRVQGHDQTIFGVAGCNHYPMQIRNTTNTQMRISNRKHATAQICNPDKYEYANVQKHKCANMVASTCANACHTQSKYANVQNVQNTQIAKYINICTLMFAYNMRLICTCVKLRKHGRV